MDMKPPRPLRVYAALLTATALAIAGFLAVREGVPSWKTVGATLLFAVLMIWTEHRSVDISEDSAANAGFLVMVAAVVALEGTSGSLLAPLLVGLSKGLYLPQMRARAWSLMGINAASAGLACLAAALVYQALPASLVEGMPKALLGAIPVSAVCILTLVVLLIPGFVFRGHVLKETVRLILPAAFESYLPFSVLGFFVGSLYALGIGAWAVVMLIVPMFIAREMFVSYIRVKRAHDETVQMLVRALEAKDSYTAGHAERVAMYAQYIGEQMHFRPSRMERLRFAALMHDIGKLVVPNHILNKPGKLTEDEFARIKTHEKVSVQMLSNIEFLRPIAGAGHSDNTRFDPDDASHPIEPYIVMIADAYDAMTSTRAYRKALPQDVAFQELRDKAGIQFHPVCVEALIAAIEMRGEKHGAGYEVQAEFEDAPEMGVGSAGLGDLLPAEA
jgi:hypothetical protein